MKTNKQNSLKQAIWAIYTLQLTSEKMLHTNGVKGTRYGKVDMQSICMINWDYTVH